VREGPSVNRTGIVVNHLPAQDADASLLMSTIRLSALKSGHFDTDCEHVNLIRLE
jgi:hypothetical protein